MGGGGGRGATAAAPALFISCRLLKSAKNSRFVFRVELVADEQAMSTGDVIANWQLDDMIFNTKLLIIYKHDISFISFSRISKLQ